MLVPAPARGAGPVENRLPDGGRMGLADCHNVADFRRVARRRLPLPIWHYLEGGADDEWTLAWNTQAFTRYELVPKVLVDVTELDTRTRVLGAELAAPLILSPTGMSRLFHHERELAVARAAGRHDLMYGLSTVATATIEEVAAASAGPKLFQVYVAKDRGLVRELVERARAAGYTALCVTVDTAVGGNRERDLRTGMALPPRFTARSLLSFALHPGWSLRAIGDPHFRLANLAHRAELKVDQKEGIAAYLDSQLDRSFSWKDAEWMADLWGGPFAIKGVMHPDDVRRAIDHGASAVMLSNHGGRQLDGAPAPVEMVEAAREVAGGRLEIIVDGGIRRGSHVVKALALGADAVSIGRPYLYALAAYGEAGVDRLLDLLLAEIRRTMALCGARHVGEIDRSLIRRPA